MTSLKRSIFLSFQWSCCYSIHKIIQKRYKSKHSILLQVQRPHDDCLQNHCRSVASSGRSGHCRDATIAVGKHWHQHWHFQENRTSRLCRSTQSRRTAVQPRHPHYQRNPGAHRDVSLVCKSHFRKFLGWMRRNVGQPRICPHCCSLCRIFWYVICPN